jgi:hypothetical protein
LFNSKGVRASPANIGVAFVHEIDASFENSATEGQMANDKFFEKHWVRFVGYFVAAFYCLLAYLAIEIVVTETIFRPPNHVFPMTDGIGWIGYLFFLSIVAGSGILAIVTAHYLHGYFRILYVAGAVAIVSAIFYLPLSFRFNADVNFQPDIPDATFIAGTWTDGGLTLDLMTDSTYQLDSWSVPGDHGRWRLDRNLLYLTPDTGAVWQKRPWEVTASSGYFFITNTIPENFDAWSGDLGLMRKADWETVHK